REPGEDDTDVEQVAEAVLGLDVGVHVVAERVTVGQHARQRQEDPRHPDPRVADESAGGRQPAERGGGSAASEGKIPVFPPRGSPTSRRVGASRPSARAGSATRAWAYITRIS